MAEKPGIVASFDECPVCALRKLVMEALKLPGKKPDCHNFYVEQLANEMKSKGWMRLTLNFYAEIVPKGQPGIVKDTDPAFVAKIPIGSAIPGYRIFLDVCTDCGCYFARKLERGEATKSVDLVQPGGGRQPTKGLPDFPVFGQG